MAGTTQLDMDPVGAVERHDSTHWAGLAGMAFAASVVVQNVWATGAGINPDADAGGEAIRVAFADHANAHGVLAAWVAANLVLLGVFAGGAHARLRRTSPMWSTVGAVGATLLMGLFSFVSIPRVALALGAERWHDELGLVDALWDLHLAAFAYAGIALGIALLGFSLAATRAGLAPQWFRVVGPVGAAVIIAFSIPVQVGASGSSVTLAGGLGFLAWLLFLLVFGARLWREGAAA